VSTVVIDAAPAAIPIPHRAARSNKWLEQHKTSLFVLSPLLVVVGAANLWNIQGWPMYVDDDEGTYVAQAWAVIHLHHLAPYTYWYDHPPLGWMLMGGYIWLTDGLQRYSVALMAGREFMWVINVIACALLYVLARRLGMRRVFAAAAVVFFGLSPLAIFFHRTVWLDNIGTLWLLAALAVTASPKRRLGTVMGSAVCMSLSVLSKETLLLMLPVWLILVWRSSDERHRGFWLASCIFSFIVFVGYPLFAALRGELFPGPGHVSLIGAIQWQLLSRQSSGSILDPASGTYGRAVMWLHQDPWLIGVGLACTVIAIFIRQARPFAIGLVMQVGMLIKGGYIPYAFVIASIPMLALVIAGVADSWWQPASAFLAQWNGGPQHAKLTGPKDRKLRPLISATSRSVVVALVVAFAAVAAPSWTRALVAQSHADAPADTIAAEHWVEQHASPGDVVVVNDYMWTDLKIHSKVTPLWLWKIDLDPWVMKNVLPKGWRSIDYIIWAPLSTAVDLSELPTLKTALAHAKLVRSFGDEITAYKVQK
jgi:hypothetical protein